LHLNPENLDRSCSCYKTTSSSSVSPTQTTTSSLAYRRQTGRTL